MLEEPLACVSSKISPSCVGDISLQCSIYQMYTEPREEVRLRIFALLMVLVQKAGPAIAAYGTEIKDILCAGCDDCYHQVNKAAASCSKLLAGNQLNSCPCCLSSAHLHVERDQCNRVDTRGKNTHSQFAETLRHKLAPISKELVAMAMPLTTHKRQGVRIAAIQAVRALMKLGAHEMILEITSFVHPNVVPIKVRKCCHNSLACRLLHIR